VSQFREPCFSARLAKVLDDASQKWSGAGAAKLTTSSGSSQILKTAPVPPPVSNEISDLLLLVSYFASQSKRIRFGDYFFDVLYQLKRFG